MASGCIVSGATVRRSLLFSKVRVEDGVDLEADRDRYTDTEKGVTLVTREMLGQAGVGD